MIKTLRAALAALTGHRAAYALLALATLAGCLGVPKEAKDWASLACYLLLALRR